MNIQKKMIRQRMQEQQAKRPVRAMTRASLLASGYAVWLSTGSLALVVEG